MLLDIFLKVVVPNFELIFNKHLFKFINIYFSANVQIKCMYIQLCSQLKEEKTLNADNMDFTFSD